MGSNPSQESGASRGSGIHEYHSEDPINEIIERTDEARMKGKTSKRKVLRFSDKRTDYRQDQVPPGEGGKRTRRRVRA